MRKAKSLRTWLTPIVPGVADNPDRLQMFVDKGAVACNGGRSLSYEQRYTLTLVFTPFSGQLDELIVPLLAWIAVNQPDLLAIPANGIAEPFSLESEILDEDQVDLSITLQLTERVIVAARGDGGYTATPLDEPRFPDVFADVDPALVLLREIFHNSQDDLIAVSHDPAWTPPA